MHTPLRIRSLVGLLPLIAVEVLEEAKFAKLEGFQKRMTWFLENRQDVARQIACMHPRASATGVQRLLAIPSRERLERVLRVLLDEREFLSPHGIRSVSRVHGEHPYELEVQGTVHRVAYDPAESTSGAFGGNSNWRGPVWFPLNYLILEALERFHHFYGDGLRVECPVGSGRMLNLQQVSEELAGRLSTIFLADAGGRRPCHGADERFARDPHWKDLVLFHEYFHGDTGRGLGASHQTGWTALVLRCIEDMAASRHLQVLAEPAPGRRPTRRSGAHAERR
jgi:hypothetical protein